MTRFLLIGNPENRRVGMFQEALAAAGEPPARVVSWLALARDAGAWDGLPDEEALVRLDSPGENFELERELLALGVDGAARAGAQLIEAKAARRLEPDLGRIVCPRQAHEGFLVLLGRVERALAARPRWRALSPPGAVAELFDKRRTSRRYAALGIPVPRILEQVRTPGVRKVFVKLACGSSASCLALVDTETDSLLTTIEMAAGGAWYNSRKLRQVSGRRAEQILDFLLGEGAQIEEAVPKARLDGQWCDCRVLVVAGEPAFTVVRRSPRPITNLHLGGTRGDPARLAAAAPPGVIDAAMASCRAVAAAHGCLHVGIDLLYQADFRGHRVIEANAFGDLLPNLTRDGLSVYGWEVRAALALAGCGGATRPTPA